MGPTKDEPQVYLEIPLGKCVRIQNVGIKIIYFPYYLVILRPSLEIFPWYHN